MTSSHSIRHCSAKRTHWSISSIAWLLLILATVGCTHHLAYVQIPIQDRRTNLQGLEALFLQYIEQHPDDWSKFIRILTDADTALHSHRFLTHAGVMRWINRAIKQEGFDERELPGLFFLRTVYLQGWEGAYFWFVNEDEQELLSDLISAVMGALHKCQTCTTAHHQLQP